MTKNIVWHGGAVSGEDRRKIVQQKGAVLWFTGLSGSGKSTIAVEVEKKITAMGQLVYRLDGDNVRHGLNSDLGFSEQDRNENIRRIAEVAALFADAQIITLVSFIAPFRRMRNFAREKTAPNPFLEIYIKADIDICAQRDPKGLYAKAKRGEIADFTGISSPYEEPQSPELLIDSGRLSVDEASQIITDKITSELLLR